jgi:hypothetical protein
MQQTLSLAGLIIPAELLNAIVGLEQVYCCTPGASGSASAHVLLTLTTRYCATHVITSSPWRSKLVGVVRLMMAAVLPVML